MNDKDLEQQNKKHRRQKTEIVRDALQTTYQRMDEKLLDQTTRETILAPQNRTVSLGDSTISASDLRYKVAETINNLGSDNQNTLDNAMDLQMMMARSIENINSETSSSQEYFRWLDETSSIIKNMNDGFVTKEDLEERNGFIEMSYQREAELLVCLSLYSNSKNPQAAEQAKAIRYKLVKLREMRSSIEATTKNKADRKVSIDEYTKALPYYKMCKGLSARPFGYDIAAQQKKNLGIYHDDDDDLDDILIIHDQLINALLDELNAKDYAPNQEKDFVFYDTASHDNTDKVPQTTQSQKEKLQHISDKLKELSGRKRLFSVNYALLEAQKRTRA